jgi:hypothetical protein
LPEDRNRLRTLELWRKHGLWPVPESELAADSQVSERKEHTEREPDQRLRAEPSEHNEQETVKALPSEQGQPSEHHEPVSLSEQAEASEHNVQTPIPSEPSERYEHEAVTTFRSEQETRSEQNQQAPIYSEPAEHYERDVLDNRIRQIAREVFKEMIDNMQNIPAVMNITDTPPEPKVIKGEGRGRREDRDYIKVSATIDKTLWELFKAERDRLKVSTGRMMDIILWRVFGKPRLSYERSEHSEPSEHSEHSANKGG